MERDIINEEEKERNIINSEYLKRKRKRER